jgi:hypothetical protein
VPLGQANSAETRAGKPTITVWRFSDFEFPFIISENLYKLQKYVENTILLGKILNKFLYNP